MSGILPCLTPREVIKALKRIGYTFVRQKGNHRIYVKEERQVVVPFHSKKLKRGTLHNIVKGTGLSPQEFILYL